MAKSRKAAPRRTPRGATSVSPPRGVAFFDFDNTLIHGDAGPLFGRSLFSARLHERGRLGRARLRARYAPYILWMGLQAGLYKVRARRRSNLVRSAYRGLKGIEVEGGRVRCEREAAGGRDVYEVPLPAVLTVLEGLNLPRYPSVPGRMRAKSKPVASSTPTRPPSRLEKLLLVVPEGQGKQAEVLGHGVDAAPRVVELLAEIGVL